MGVKPIPTPSPEDRLPTVSTQAEERVSVASNWQLVWWRFKKHRLALISVVVLVIFYIIVLFPDFFAVLNPEETNERLTFIPIQAIHFFQDGKLDPWVPG